MGTLVAASAVGATAVPQLAGAYGAVIDQQQSKKKKPKQGETSSGVKFIELKEGTGAYPNPGDFVVMSYTAFLNDGTVYDTTEIKGKKALSFRFGKKQVIPGVEEVLETMRVCPFFYIYIYIYIYIHILVRLGIHAHS
jgi:FKBP-type peptidyl-prolyl cis-trans isomerase